MRIFFCCCCFFKSFFYNILLCRPEGHYWSVPCSSGESLCSMALYLSLFLCVFLSSGDPQGVPGFVCPCICLCLSICICLCMCIFVWGRTLSECPSSPGSPRLRMASSPNQTICHWTLDIKHHWTQDTKKVTKKDIILKLFRLDVKPNTVEAIIWSLEVRGPTSRLITW